MNYLLTGNDQGLVTQQLTKIISQITKEQNCQILSFDVQEHKWTEILAALNTANLFYQHTIVVIKNATFLVNKEARDALQGNYQELINYCSNPCQDTTLVLEYVGDKKFLTDSKTKALINHLQHFPVAALSIGEWAKWIKLYFQKHNQTITQAAIDLMLERLPLEFNIIKNEVDKLLLFNQPITKSIVAEQTIYYSNANAFDLTVQILQSETEKFLNHFHQLLKQGFSWTQLLGALNYNLAQIRNLKIGVQQGKTLKELSIILKLNWYQVQKLNKYLNKWNYQQLATLVDTIMELDDQAKKGFMQTDSFFEWNMLKLFFRGNNAKRK